MQNSISTTSIQILTPSGYQPFDGIKRWKHENIVMVEFDNGSICRCALDHRFIVCGKEVYAKDLSIGSVIGKRIVKRKTIRNEPQWLYDPINVANGEIYCHDDGLISHNSFGRGTGNTLLTPNCLLGLRAITPIETKGNTNIYHRPKKDHTYILCSDVSRGRGQDYSTINILDVTEVPFKQVATYRNNLISPILLPDVIYELAKLYNDAYCIIESNDQGSLVFRGLRYDYEYENVYVSGVRSGTTLGFETTKKTKRIGCSNIKDLIEQGKLELYDAETIKEFTTFEARGSSYEASPGNHDDLVMSLVIFGYFASTNMFGYYSNENMRTMLADEKSRLLEESIPFIGHINIEEETDVVHTIEDPINNVVTKFKLDDIFGVIIEEK